MCPCMHNRVHLSSDVAGGVAARAAGGVYVLGGKVARVAAARARVVRRGIWGSGCVLGGTALVVPGGQLRRSWWSSTGVAAGARFWKKLAPCFNTVAICVVTAYRLTTTAARACDTIWLGRPCLMNQGHRRAGPGELERACTLELCARPSASVPVTGSVSERLPARSPTALRSAAAVLLSSV